MSKKQEQDELGQQITEIAETVIGDDDELLGEKTKEDDIKILEQKFTKAPISKEWCKVDLTTDELDRIADKFAQLHGIVAQLEIERKSTATKYKSLIDGNNAELGDLAEKRRNKYEMQYVDCWEDWDWNSGVVRYIRTDTGIVHKSRSITASERQEQLNLVNNQKEDE